MADLRSQSLKVLVLVRFLSFNSIYRNSRCRLLLVSENFHQLSVTILKFRTLVCIGIIQVILQIIWVSDIYELFLIPQIIFPWLLVVRRVVPEVHSMCKLFKILLTSRSHEVIAILSELIPFLKFSQSFLLLKHFLYLFDLLSLFSLAL